MLVQESNCLDRRDNHLASIHLKFFTNFCMEVEDNDVCQCRNFLLVFFILKLPITAYKLIVSLPLTFSAANRPLDITKDSTLISEYF